MLASSGGQSLHRNTHGRAYLARLQPREPLANNQRQDTPRATAPVSTFFLLCPYQANRRFQPKIGLRKGQELPTFCCSFPE
ncbi:unnamed protein product [Acanthoscelides obtectus]|uniref:Uncharacterized protein n=1 Tax=Acanthoscelides obtectus TaxID=200917 RepID=A0A9P0PUR0_ACAOB|nr:unnamed protein product [Acanthoscelides obtectus]CAK1630243.1 hypothetical protein AOBTE_LOCUS6222 [Acanthoscelides obtectus]